LADRLVAICQGAPNGSPLAQRCSDLSNSTDPQAFLRAAIGQRLDEIPGQARVATRDFSAGLRGLRRGGGPAPDDATALLLQAGPAALSVDGDGDEGLAARWSLYFSADAGRLDRRAGTNEAAFEADTASATLGVDWQAGADWQIGVAANHVREDLDFSASDSVAGTRFSGLLLTASRALGDTWSLTGYAGRYRGRYDLQRAIAYTLPLPGGAVSFSAVARARPDAERDVAGLSLDGRWARDGWDWGLTTGLDSNKTRIEAYRETGGGGLDLEVPGREVGTRRGHLDVSLGRTFSHARGVFQPSLRLGWRQEFGNPRRPVTLRLGDDPGRTGINFETEDPDRGWGEVALGGVMTFTGGHSGFFELRQRVAHSFLDERMLAVGWRIEM
jgi:uncharacterized protein YhjY with autotransporter beta-barrel domain